MIVKNLMKKDFVTIPHTATYYEAAKILHSHNISGAPIVDEQNKLVGIRPVKFVMIALKSFFRGIS